MVKINNKSQLLDVSESDASVFKMFSTSNVRMRSRISNGESSPTMASKSVLNFDIQETDQSTQKAYKKVSALRTTRKKEKWPLEESYFYKTKGAIQGK